MFKIIEAGRSFTLVEERDGKTQACCGFKPYEEGKREEALEKVRAYASGFIDGFNHCRSSMKPVYLKSDVEVIE